MSIKIFVILAVVMRASVHANQLEDELTDSQIRRIFHRNRDELPNYKTTTLNTPKNYRSKRDVRPVEFEVDGKKIQLNLTPVKHNSLTRDIPVWTVETDYEEPLGRKYVKVDEEEVNYDGMFYEDKENMATLLAYYKDRYIHYDGVFGESYYTKVVRSLPEKWWSTPGKQSHDDHVIFNVNHDGSKTETIGGSDNVSDANKLTEPLDVLYPKLLLIVEYNYFKALAENVPETIKYIATFWNAVNLKYSKLESPRVRIVISGVIIAKDDTALRYIYDARNQTDMNTMNHLRLLKGGSDYFRQEFKSEVDFANYDSTITMTTLEAGSVAGSAYPGRICSPDYNVGFIKDDSSFSGVLTATHELGHLLNLPHDGEDRATDCEGYPKYEDEDKRMCTVMAPYMINVKGYYWSTCSKRILHNFASMKAAECMRYPSRL